MIRVLAVVLALCSIARADQPKQDAVALLPLDADARLEIYGQPVAGEVARALGAGGIDVVVVGPKMSIPERARLVVDGTITAGKGDTISLSVRIRDRVTGATLDTLPSSATSLQNIDAAAAELAQRLLPAVRAKLEALHKPADPQKPIRPPTPEAPPQPLLYGIDATGFTEPFRSALAAEAAAFARAHHREPKPVDGVALSRQLAIKTVSASQADFGLAFEDVTYTTSTTRTIPTATVRVRARIANGTQILFDRVIVTDTIVGDKDLPADQLAARAAREVLVIVQPHLARLVATWR